MEGLRRWDAVRRKFTEASECRRERRMEMEMESEGSRRMRGAQVDNKLNIRSAPRRSSLSIRQETRAEQQEAPTHRRVRTGGAKTEGRMEDKPDASSDPPPESRSLQVK